MARQPTWHPAMSEMGTAWRPRLLESTDHPIEAGAVGPLRTDGGEDSGDAGSKPSAPLGGMGEKTAGAVGGRAPGDLTLIAHRGFAGENPENTVTAARAATGRPAQADVGVPSRRADIIEVDVVPTAEDEVVVFHDNTLAGRDGGDRGLTDATGVVWENDTATVTNAEVLGSGDTVPRLSTLLEAVPSDVGVNVELKNPGRYDLRFAEKLSEPTLSDRTAVWQPFVDRVVDVLDNHENPILCSSFCEGALAATRGASSYPVAPILWESIDDGLAVARAHDAAAVHAPMKLIAGTSFHEPLLTTGVDLVAEAHADGRAVNVWTVKTWHQAAELAAAGVDGIAADYSGLLPASVDAPVEHDQS